MSSAWPASRDTGAILERVSHVRLASTLRTMHRLMHVPTCLLACPARFTRQHRTTQAHLSVHVCAKRPTTWTKSLEMATTPHAALAHPALYAIRMVPHLHRFASKSASGGPRSCRGLPSRVRIRPPVPAEPQPMFDTIAQATPRVPQTSAWRVCTACSVSTQGATTSARGMGAVCHAAMRLLYLPLWLLGSCCFRLQPLSLLAI